MRNARIIKIACAIVGAPFFLFALGYCLRWVLTGQWVPGGGDRAMIGFLVSIPFACAVGMAEIER